MDWFEATAKLGGERCVLQFFAMRSMGSGDAFHRAYTNATQQAFLEGHEHGFAYFGGVFRTLRYDNLSSAVKKILRGRQREETNRVIAFRSHWGFQSEYCNPASGNEKGGVEGEVGRYRRNWLVPVPEAADLAELNQRLLAGCLASRNRTISGRTMTVGEASQMERPQLLPLAEEGFPIDEILYPLIVDSKGRVKVKTNWYSAPLWPGLRVTARVWPSLIEIEHDGNAWPVTSETTDAATRSSTSNTTLTYWRRSRARWPGRRRWSSGGRPDAGRSVWIESGRNSRSVTARAAEPER